MYSFMIPFSLKKRILRPYAVKNKKTLSDRKSCGFWMLLMCQMLLVQRGGASWPRRYSLSAGKEGAGCERLAVKLMPLTLSSLFRKMFLMSETLHQLLPGQHYNIQHLRPSFRDENPVLAGGPGTSSQGLWSLGQAQSPFSALHQVYGGKVCPRGRMFQAGNFHWRMLGNRNEPQWATGHSSAHTAEATKSCPMTLHFCFIVPKPGWGWDLSQGKECYLINAPPTNESF